MGFSPQGWVWLPLEAQASCLLFVPDEPTPNPSRGGEFSLSPFECDLAKVFECPTLLRNELQSMPDLSCFHIAVSVFR